MAKKEPAGRYISMVKVGEKGQIVIPKAARAMFDIQPGSMLVLLADTERGIALISPEQPVFSAMMDVATGADQPEDPELTSFMKGGMPDGNPVD